jgi:DNA-binding CsgD family transcriptional regulator
MAIDAAGLVAGFYEAVFDPARLPDTLRELGAFGGGLGAALLLWDTRADSPLLHVTCGHTGPDAAEAYRGYYAPLDPYRPLVATLPSGVWTTSTELFDDAFVAKDRFFNEYLLPRGTRYVASARVVAGDACDGFIGIHRGPAQTPFSRDELRRFESVGRHLARAIKVYIDVAHARPAQNAAMAVLEQAAPPALLVDASGRVLFANPAAEALLAANEAIGVRDRRLSAGQAADERRLQRLIAAATGALGLAPAGGEMLVGRAGQPPIALLVAPVGPTTTLSSLAPVPAALVLLHDPARRAAHPTKRLQALFGLTAAEAMLAQGLLDGKRLTEIAAARKVSVETVRTQLRALFRKTGVARQADLMRILLALPERRSG